MLIWIHPVLQTLAGGLSLYVLYLGWVRFRAAHLGDANAVFAWKRHVLLGKIVLTTWGLTFFIGLSVVWLDMKRVFVTGQHYKVALLMLPLIAFGLGTGLVMDRVKAKRTALPLAHGSANALLVLLGLYQLYTGMAILRGMIQP
jgi:hypothetical protein